MASNTTTRERTRPTAGRKPLTMFSFGYWGNGRDVGSLVRAVQAGERDRGYEPPLWVDIRLRRAVRAEGFRGDLFERRMRTRYVWMQDLGNESIADGTSGIRIRRPDAASELLDLALADKKRRIIFFCACEFPCDCHRRRVARLLITRARQRGIDLRVVEWPGGEPEEFEAPVARGELGRLLRGDLSRVNLPASIPAKAAATKAWGSVAHLHAGEEEGFAIVAPARFGTHGSYFPVLEVSRTEPSKELRKRLQKRFGADPLLSR